MDGLEGLHQLRELVLDRNRIKALADNSFIAQNVLLELHLAENRIRELSNLEPLTELRKLFLGMNKLQVFSLGSCSLLVFIFRLLLKLHVHVFNETALITYTTVISCGDHQGRSKLLSDF